jgi:hypothetical protein
MNVYVESGFVLALALQQDDHQAAQRVLQLAQRHLITLKIPTFSLSEPFSTVRYRANNRNRLVEELRKEARELRRTQPHENMAAELGQYIIQMTHILQTQLDAMEAVVLDLSHSCELLQLDAGVVMRASDYRAIYDLQLPDAIVLASITLDLERTRNPSGALFVSQNVKDFEHPSVQEILQYLDCKYLADFTNAVRFIERQANRPE